MIKNAILKETKDGVASTKLAKQTPQSTKPRAGSNEDTLKEVLKMVDSWLSYRKKLIPIWERSIKLYNNKRVEKHFEGVADTFVPMSRSTVETIVSALATGDLSTEFMPQDIYKYLVDRLSPGYTENEDETKDQFLVRAIREALKGGAITDETLKALNALYDYYWDSGDWSRKLEQFIKSGVKIGNAAWWLTWEKSRPRLITVPFPDFVFDPNGIDDDSCKFLGRRYFACLDDMKSEMIIDPQTGKQRKRYNFAGLKKFSESNEKNDKQLKEEMMFGSVTYSADESNDDQVEVIEIRTKDKAYVLVNRCCIAEDAENPILSQAKIKNIPTDDLILLPGISWANYEDESLYIGTSEIETFWKEQERLNDTVNQKSDAVTRALLQTYRADPSLKAQKKSFSVPGAVIWAAAGQYEATNPAIVPAAAFNEEASIKNNIREVTATDQIVKGVGQSGDVTATEAQLQVSQAGQRIESKIDSLARGPLKRLARLTLQYVRLFVADPFIVPQQSNGGIKPYLFDPNNYNYVFEPKVTLTIQAQSKRRQDQGEARQTYQMLIQDPTNNLQEVKKVLLPKIVDIDKDDLSRMTTQAPQPTGMPPEMPIGMPPQPQGMPVPAGVPS